MFKPNYSIDDWGREEALRRRRFAYEAYQKIDPEHRPEYLTNVVMGDEQK
jgi:hypothetical protein